MARAVRDLHASSAQVIAASRQLRADSLQIRRWSQDLLRQAERHVRPHAAGTPPRPPWGGRDQAIDRGRVS